MLPVAPLPEVEVKKLTALAAKFGIPRAPDPCTLCNACPNGRGGVIHSGHAAGASPPVPALPGDPTTDGIVEAVVRKLRGG